MRAPNGKPSISNSNKEISISHSRSLLFITAGSGQQGCDIEFIEHRKQNEWDDMLDNKYGQVLEQLKIIDNDYDLSATRIWCVREALIKSLGMIPLIIGIEKLKKGKTVLVDGVEKTEADRTIRVGGAEQKLIPLDFALATAQVEATIAVRGNSKYVNLAHDAQPIVELGRVLAKRVKDQPQSWDLQDKGTPGLVSGLNAAGIFPTRNFRQGAFEGVDKLVLKYLHIDGGVRDISRWEELVNRINNPQDEVSIGLVGKYVDLPE